MHSHIPPVTAPHRALVRGIAALLGVGALAGVAGLTIPALASAQGYTVTPVGALPPYTVGSSSATGISPTGRVVGSTAGLAGGATRAAFVTGPDGVTRLGLLPGTSSANEYSRAMGVNAAGRVVGGSSNALGATVAFIAGPEAGGGLTALGLLPGAPPGATSLATAINSAGRVVGYATDAAGRQQAFITGPNGAGGLTGLGFFPGAPGGFTQALAVNDAGLVVGYGATGTGYEAFVTGPGGTGGLTGLGYLPGGAGPGAFSIANGINAAGWIVGTSSIAGGLFEAFIAGPGGAGRLLGLGSLPGASGVDPFLSQAFGINAEGRVVGSALNAAGVREGFVTGPGGMGGLTALAALVGDGWVITDAVAINDAGQIAANGYNPAFNFGLPQALLLTPTVVPEPSPVALLAAGAVVLGVARCRRPAGRR